MIELATRMIVGWQTADHLRTSLVTDALAALDGGHVSSEAIFHSDRGCWDNAATESFFAALKNECYHRQHFPTRARARFAGADLIEVVYNRQRLHSTLGCRTPTEALTDHHRRAAA